MKNLEEARIIRLPRIYDPRGNLTFVQNGDEFLPFKVERVYWTYDVPAGEQRGGHSHHVGKELLIAISGSFNVNLFDGIQWQTFTLNRPFEGLYIPAGYWRTLDNFASGSVCMVLTSTPIARTTTCATSKISRNWLLMNSLKYPFLDLGKVNSAYIDDLKQAADRVLDSRPLHRRCRM